MDSPPSHDIVAASADDVAHEQARSSSRRRLFGAGLGVVAALSPVLTRTASAAPEDSAPKRPTEDDLVLLRFAHGAELAARDLYDAALESGRLDEASVPVFTAIREAHEAYAHAFAGIVGTSAGDAPAAGIFGSLAGRFSVGSASLVASAGAELEGALAATHRSLLGQLEGVDAAAVVASIVPIEGRHATVLQTLAGRSSLDDLILNDAQPLQPEV